MRIRHWRRKISVGRGFMREAFIRKMVLLIHKTQYMRPEASGISFYLTGSGLNIYDLCA